MDIPTVNMGGVFKGASSGPVGPKPKALADVPMPKPEAEPLAKATTPEPKAVAAAQDAGYEAVRKAAQAVLKNTYAVSDVTFTIFKDVAGDYVTRFTSLRDGSTKYYPQKTLFELAQIANHGGEYSDLV